MTPVPHVVERAAEYVLILSCPDRPGIVHAVTGFLVEQGSNIVESQQYGDAVEQRFFMRVHVEVVDRPDVTVEGLREAFGPVAERFGMTWHLWDRDARYRTLIM